MVQLKVLKPTFLKATTDQASELDDVDKVPLEQGAEYTVHSWAIDNHNHLKIAFNQGFGRSSRNTWLVYEPHVELIAADGEALKPENEDETAPKSDRTTSEPAIVRATDAKSKKIQLPFGKTIDLYAPIISKGDLYWYEATHNGTRLPQRVEHLEAIVRTARMVQKARDQIGRPFEVTSFYRPEPWNSRAKGASQSTHLTGSGIDFKVSGMTGKQLAKALEWWPSGLGIYKHLPNIIHLDSRGYRARWGL